MLVLAPLLVLPQAVAEDDRAGVDDLGQVVDIGVVLDRVMGAVGDRYGGAWVESTSSPSILVVGIVNPTVADRVLLSTVAGAGASRRLRLTPVGVPASKLAALKDQLTAVLDATDAGYTISVDAAAQKVRVDADRLDPSVVEVIRASAAPERLSLVVDPALAPQADHQTRNAYPPYESGLHITAPHGCTSAFVVLAAGPHGTTAGHCAEQGDQVRIGGHRVGDVDGDTLPGAHIAVRSDAVRFAIPGSARTARIYVGSGRHRTVTGDFSDAELLEGTPLCFQGSSSGGGNCGQIIRAHERVRVTGPHGYTLTDAWRLNTGSRPGDSGGPVYQELPDGAARAAGLVSAGVPNHYMLFTSIGHILQDLDASLFTASQQ